MSEQRIVVIGGGVVGLCTAWYAASRGHDVTVVDRQSITHQGCSYGNAGMITPSHFVPLAAPGAVRNAFRWMFDDESPFYVRPRLDPALLAWGVKFNRAATRAHVERSAPLLLHLNLASLHCYEELARKWDEDFGLRLRGMLMLCASAHGLDEERRTAALAQRLGVAAEILDAPAVAELEPGISMAITGGAFYPNDAILSPTRFMQALLARLQMAGVELRFETGVSALRERGGRVTSVSTDAGEIEGDEFVVCAGSWSPQLLRTIGIDLPLQAGKGYSLTLPSPPQLPTRGMILSEAHVAVTPIGRTLRFGGTMEIAGLDESIRPSRVRGIVKGACRYLPQFTPNDFDGVEPWCGLRPCSPDGLPYLGRFASLTNLSAATGHAMMGMSLGPISGRLMSEILSGDRASLDVSMLSPDRYSSG